MTKIRYNNDIRTETAGSLMVKQYITVQKNQTIKQAIDHLRATVGGMKNVHYVYITNEHNHVVGVLSIRELLSADDELFVEQVMITDVVTLPKHVDQEEAAQVFQDTDLVSIPVINKRNQIIGVVHVEDILDVMEFEATEDMHKMGSVVSATAEEYEGGLLDASIRFLYRKRIVWLVILVFVNVFSGAGIAYFEDVIAANIALVFFLPLLIDSGGNAGSQSATLVIRAMATGNVQIRDWFKMITKELAVSALIGLTMAFAVSFVGIARGGIDIALVVSLTMMLIVIVGSMIGISLPFIFQKFKLDPATASAPLVTSIADISGVLIYFAIASAILTI